MKHIILVYLYFHMKLERKSQFLQLLIVAINLQEEVEAKTKVAKKLNYLDQILSKKGLYIMILLIILQKV